MNELNALSLLTACVTVYYCNMNDDCCAAAETQSDVYGASKRVFSVVIFKL